MKSAPSRPFGSTAYESHTIQREPSVWKLAAYLMNQQICISAKNLGSIALPEFCPRCYWIAMHVGFRLPYSIFPGIFSSIDAYTKRMVHRWLDKRNGAPSWLDGIGELAGYKEPPHWSRFSTVDTTYNIQIRGVVDAIFVRPDGSHVIGDYKTAKFTDTQDELFPMYEAQLNAYAKIGEECGFAPVSGLALIYFEPLTDPEYVDEAKYRTDGFAIDFRARVMPVERDDWKLKGLLSRAREIFEEPRPPRSRPRCEDCAKLASIVDALVRGAAAAA